MKTGIYLAARVLGLSRYRYILMHTVIATHGQARVHTHTRTHTQTSKRAMGPCMLGFKLFGPTLGPS